MTLMAKPNKDVAGGLLIVALGVVVVVHSLQAFVIGSLSQMGPGFFPLSLGVILMLSGAAIAIKGHLSAEPKREDGPTKHKPEWKAWLLICLGMASFAMLGKYFGLVPATFSVVFISAFADRKNTWKSALGLACSMVVISVVVFWWALQIQLPLFKLGGV